MLRYIYQCGARHRSFARGLFFPFRLRAPTRRRCPGRRSRVSGSTTCRLLAVSVTNTNSFSFSRFRGPTCIVPNNLPFPDQPHVAPCGVSATSIFLRFLGPQSTVSLSVSFVACFHSTSAGIYIPDDREILPITIFPRLNTPTRGPASFFRETRGYRAFNGVF